MILLAIDAACDAFDLPPGLRDFLAAILAMAERRLLGVWLDGAPLGMLIFGQLDFLR